MNLPENFWVGVLGSLIFGVIGLVLLIGGFLVFDKLLTRVDFQKKMDESPVACAIVVGAFLLAVAYIAAHVVH